MPRVKALLVVLLVIAFSFSLLGCGFITSRTASTDEVVEMGGQVPEWLLLSHRSIASEENDHDDDLAAIDEEDEEADEAVGGVDEDDGVTADSGQTEQTSSEVAQAAESGSSGSTQQQQTSSSQQQESSGESEYDRMVAKIKPGNREYNFYMANRKDSQETPEQFVSRLLKEREEEENQQGSMMSDWDGHSPTGWGHTVSDDDDD